MQKHRIRYLVNDAYSRIAKKHIEWGDLKRYTADDTYIYKELTHEEYTWAINNGLNEPFIMEELGLEAEYDYNYKPE